jgi:hypothetical protein
MASIDGSGGLTTGDPRLQALLDRSEITDLINRYGQGIRQRTPDLVVSCFAPDARLDYGFTQIEGIEAVRAFFEGVASGAGSASPSHLDQRAVSTPVMTNIQIDLAGDSAHCESLCLAIHAGVKQGREAVVVRGTQNSDDLVRTAEGWKITKRTHMLHWSFEAAGTPTA